MTRPSEEEKRKERDIGGQVSPLLLLFEKKPLFRVGPLSAVPFRELRRGEKGNRRGGGGGKRCVYYKKVPWGRKKRRKSKKKGGGGGERGKKGAKRTLKKRCWKKEKESLRVEGGKSRQWLLGPSPPTGEKIPPHPPLLFRLSSPSSRKAIISFSSPHAFLFPLGLKNLRYKISPRRQFVEDKKRLVFSLRIGGLRKKEKKAPLENCYDKYREALFGPLMGTKTGTTRVGI